MQGFAALDLETTGLSAASDRIIEIGVVQLDARGHETGIFTTLVNPERPVSATRIHGITDDDVRSAPTFSAVVDSLAEVLRGRAIVAHNARFDVGFLNASFRRAGYPMNIPASATVCTMDESRIYLPEGRHSLLAATARAGVPLPHHHRALGDARAAAGLLRVYMEREEAGERYAELAYTREGLPVHPREWVSALAEAEHLAWPEQLF